MSDMSNIVSFIMGNIVAVVLILIIGYAVGVRYPSVGRRVGIG